MPSLNKIVIWRENNSGKINITTFFSEGKLNNESDEDFINREILKLKKSSNGKLDNITFFIKDKSEFHDLIKNSKSKNKRAILIDENGNLSHDDNFVDEKVKNKNKINSIKNKLMNAKPLTEDEVNFLIK